MPSPELNALVNAKRANPYRDDASLEQLRAESEGRIEANPLPEGTEVTAVTANGVPAEWINAPGSSGEKVIYFIHGGGYYRGTVASSRSPAAEMSKACGLHCLSIDYRLAPEATFPAAVNDVVAGYHWLLEQGLTPAQIAVTGISAGGGLTGALLLALKNNGETLPACAIPISPWMDLTQNGRSFQASADADPVISKAYLDRWSREYLGDTDPYTPLASPLFGDLVGLPPLLIQVGSAETMLDDSVAFARAAGMANVDVSLEIWPHCIHGWHGSPHLPETQAAMQSIAAFIDRVMVRARVRVTDDSVKKKERSSSASEMAGLPATCSTTEVTSSPSPPMKPRWNSSRTRMRHSGMPARRWISDSAVRPRGSNLMRRPSTREHSLATSA